MREDATNEWRAERLAVTIIGLSLPPPAGKTDILSDSFNSGNPTPFPPLGAATATAVAAASLRARRYAPQLARSQGGVGASYALAAGGEGSVDAS